MPLRSKKAGSEERDGGDVAAAPNPKNMQKVQSKTWIKDVAAAIADFSTAATRFCNVKKPKILAHEGPRIRPRF